MRIFFGGLLAVLSMTLPAAAVGCAPGGDVDSSSAEEGEDVETARSPLPGAAPRFEASSLSYPHRLALADATMAYLDDAFVDESHAALSVAITSGHDGERDARTYFLDLRSRLETMEAYLSGTPAAVTLTDGRMPFWDTAHGVPTGLRGVDPEDDGTPREPIGYPDKTPILLPTDTLCSRAWFQNETLWTTEILYFWEREYIQRYFGGVLAQREAPAAAIYWPLQVDVAQHYEIWEGCHAFPSPAVVDDDLSGWTVTGPGAVSQVSDDGGAPWSNVFRVAGAPTGTTTIYRDVSISADSIGKTAKLLAFTRTSSEVCEGGRAKVRLSFFNGSSLISMTTGDEIPSDSYQSSELAATVPAGTTKIRMTILVSARPANLACTGQHASVDDVRLMLY